MLTKIIAKNWKSLEAAELNIDAITVLIGSNASGKSNVLDAFLFLQRTASGVLLTSALQGDGSISAMRGGLDCVARKPGNRFSLSTTIKGDEDTTEFDYKIECEVGGGQCELRSEQLIRRKFRLSPKGKRHKNPSIVQLFRTDSVDPDSPTITARLYNGKQGSPRQLSRASCVLFQLTGQKLTSDIQHGVRAIVDAHQAIFILDPIPSHMRAYTAFSERLLPDAANIAGVLAALPPTQKDEVEKTLTRYGSKLPERDIVRVYSEPVGKFNSDAMLYCEEGFSETQMLLDARGMSDGTLRFLAILMALLTRPENSLLVVEEVDNGLHPSRSNLLLHMLRTVGEERKVDVMVTTHNPALLDAMGTEMVPFITVAHRNRESGATELTLLEDIEDLPRLLASGTVGKLSSKGAIEEALVEQKGSSVDGQKSSYPRHFSPLLSYRRCWEIDLWASQRQMGQGAN
jgi:predicted ATPase